MFEHPDPTVYAVPFFLLTVMLEAFVLRRAPADGSGRVGYEKKDTIASLAMGVGSLFFVVCVNFVVFTFATFLYQHRLFELGEGVLGWAVALIGWDFGYYWHHRLEHEVRFFWAGHVNHHSSQHYNLSTALRQPWTPISAPLIFPWLSLLGVAPWMILMSGGFNLVYQYWIHTEVIQKLPKPIEAVFNTPSHHRVHHGSNDEYLDKNYGGALIIWDRLFGTFEPEKARAVYGLTKNLTSYNLLVIAFHEYVQIARDLRRARTWRGRASLLLRSPTWLAHHPVEGVDRPSSPPMTDSHRFP